MFNPLLDFITPQFNPFDPLQVGFATMIGLCLVCTVWSVRHNANARNWERIWCTGPAAGKGNLDIEHGSVNDLSNAVATRAERLAEIMPGMLLILGLLGTFLGLGMALDKASTLLASAGGTDGVTPDTMQNMMAMMHGLGSKFKTSTWGILAFLALKTYGSVNAYDERRLVWCVAKMKTEVDRHREELRAIGAAYNARMVAAIESMSAALLHSADIGAGAAQGRHAELAAAAAVRHQEMQAVLTLQLEHGQATRGALQAFVGSVDHNIGAMADAAREMEQAAKGNAASTKELRGAIGTFQHTVAEVLSDMKRDLNATISSMSDDFKLNMRAMAGELGNVSREIASAVGELNHNVGTILVSVKEANDISLSNSVKAHLLFTQSSDQLNSNMSQMGKMVEALGDDIEQGLSAVSSSGQEMKRVALKFDEVGKKLVDSMVPNAAMKDAVNDLLAHLTTNQGVAPTISDIRKAADKLGGEIASGLHAVSLAGQEMARSARLLEPVPETMDQNVRALGAMTGALNALLAKMRVDADGTV